ncbi:hypothetical protein [Vibrio harveyi]|uniref:hypothetical protein n=1 Tax=Vibrio harveyi TaxID=669 RepID=UPI003D724354
MKTISKEKYQEILLTQLDYLSKKDNPNPNDLRAVIAAYEDSKLSNYEEVQVVENNGAFSFKPVLSEQ